MNQRISGLSSSMWRDRSAVKHVLALSTRSVGPSSRTPIAGPMVRLRSAPTRYCERTWKVSPLSRFFTSEVTPSASCVKRISSWLKCTRASGLRCANSRSTGSSSGSGSGRLPERAGLSASQVAWLAPPPKASMR